MLIKKGIADVVATVFVTSLLMSSSLIVDAVDTDETGNTMFDPNEYNANEVVSSMLTRGDDNDWYSFTLEQPSKINIICQGQGNQDDWFAFELYDVQNDNSIVYSVKNKNSVNQTLFLRRGDYLVHLSPYWDELGYYMKITSTPCNLNVPGDGSNNALGDATAVDFETEFNAQISQNDTADYYTIDLPNDAYVTFNFSGAVNSVDWVLYDNQDDLIKHGVYQKKNTTDSKITESNSLRLKAGKYTVYLGANEKAPSYGPYTFSFNYSEKLNDTTANGIIALGDVNKDGIIDSTDASSILEYYAYTSTGGTNTDMEAWMAAKE